MLCLVLAREKDPPARWVTGSSVFLRLVLHAIKGNIVVIYAECGIVTMQIGVDYIVLLFISYLSDILQTITMHILLLLLFFE